MFLLVCFVFASLFFFVSNAFSQFPPCMCVACDCASLSSAHENTIETINELVTDYIDYLIDDVINDEFIEEYWNPALEAFGTSTVLSSQKNALEIKSNLSTYMQHMRAQAVMQQKRYDTKIALQPDEGACTVITATQSLISSDAKSKGAQSVMTRRGLGRSLGVAGDMASRGPDQDRLARFQFASSRYFTGQEMGGALADYATATDDRRFRADVSPHTLLEKGTLAIDLDDDVLTADEEDIFSLKTNLYNHKTLTRLSASDLRDVGSFDELDDLQGLAAFRAISEFSFDSIVALKASGDSNSGFYIEAILRDLGYDSLMIDRHLGAVTAGSRRPSYLKQLEILAKTIQITPDRQIAETVNATEAARRLAIREAVELMVKFEIYRSYQRSTVMAATLHELKRREFQDRWEANPIFVGEVK